MAKKYRLEQKVGSSMVTLHPETDASVVQYSGTIGGTAVTNAKAAIDALETEIGSLDTGVTGVKGSAEATYRTGDVNITAANVGAQPAFTDGSATIASKSGNVVTLKAGVAQSGGKVANSSASDITLAAVASTGSYNDLSNKPTIPAAQIQSDWSQTDSTKLDYIKNKPTIPTVNDGTLTLQVGGTTKATFTANQSTAATFNVTAADLGLSGAMHFKGVVEGSELPATTNYSEGDVIVLGDTGKEYVLALNGTSGAKKWNEFGDEGSYALKTVTVTGTGALGGGGTLEANRTITHNYGSAASKASGFYKFSTDAYSHVGSVTAVTKADLTGLIGSSAAASGGTALSLVTTGEKYTWNSKAAGSHTHGNVTNDGKVTATAITAANTSYFVVTDSSNNIQRVSKSDMITAIDSAIDHVTHTEIACDSGDLGLIYTNATGQISVLSIPTNGTASDYIRLPYVDAQNASLEYMKPSSLTVGSAASATTATKFSSVRSITLTGDATGTASSDGTSGWSIATTLANSGVTAGGYSAVTVNAKGIVTAAGKSIEVGTTLNADPSASLYDGGIFFRYIAD